VIEEENLLQNAQEVGDYLVSLLQNQKYQRNSLSRFDDWD
jgi:4-aminobutyrate aminotransferase-like enzyme